MRLPTTADLIADHGKLMIQRCRHCGQLTIFDCDGIILCALCDTDDEETSQLRSRFARG